MTGKTLKQFIESEVEHLIRGHDESCSPYTFDTTEEAVNSLSNFEIIGYIDDYLNLKAQR